jgi:choline dehydrogenase-like flavoprotein
LSTSAIYLRSLLHAGDANPVLTGLMDNRQIHIPFVTPGMFGQPIAADAYQYHRLAVVVEDAQLPASCHGQLTTLKAALTHPILQRLPIGLRSAVRLLRNVRSGMGLLNLSFPDTRRRGNQIRLVRTEANGRKSSLQVVIDYHPPAAEHQNHRRVKRRVRRFMRQLGCRTFGFWNSTRNMGASIHYAGTIPMSSTPAPHTVNPIGNSHDFPNLWIVDASVFPSLPAKSLTLTTMANAVRTARLMLDSVQ